MEFKLSNRSINRLKGVHPRLIDLIVTSLKKSPIDFGIPQLGGVRTAEEQNDLFDKKLSNCDGYDNESYHQSGKAVDVYAWHNRKASWEPHHLNIIAGVILSTAKDMGLTIRWGGTFGSDDFKGWDLGHYQITI